MYICFRHTAIAHIIDNVSVTFMCIGKPKKFELALLRWSGTEHAVSPRSACVLKLLFGMCTCTTVLVTCTPAVSSVYRVCLLPSFPDL